MNHRAAHKTLRSFAPLSLLLALSGAALAETSPYYIGGSLGLTRISNPYRAADGTVFPDSAPKNDTYTTLSLLAGIDQPFGRERLYGTARLSDNRWQHNSSLNGRSYDISGGLDWEASNRWSGTVKAGFNEDLSLSPVERLGSGVSTTSFDRNVRNTESLDATVQYGVDNRLSAVAGAGYRSVSYSSPVYDYLEYTQSDVSFRLQYTEGGALTLGIGPRFTRGTYPTATCRRDSDGTPIPGYRCTGDTADNYTRRDLDLTAKWTASGASIVEGRLSYGKERHSEFQQDRDTRGFNGFVAWYWTPTGKLHLSTSLQRDDGQDIYFSGLNTGSGANNYSDYSTVTTAFRVGAQYDVSSKIGVNAAIRYARRPLTSSYTNSQNQPVTDSGTDNTVLLTLGGTWAPTRSTLIGCDISAETRTTTNPQVSVPYSTNSFGCYGQIILR